MTTNCDSPSKYINGYSANGSQVGSGSLAASHINWAEIKNPIEDQIRDKQSLQDFFKTMPFIPYAGTWQYSADSLLQLLYTLCVVSPSQHACLNSIKEFAFGGKIKIVESIDESFILSDEMPDLGIETQKKYIEFLSSITKREGDWMEFASNCYTGYGYTGDIYIMVVMSDVAGQKSAAMYVVDNRNVRYVNDGNYNMLAISDRWDTNYITKYQPEYIPVYPNMTEKDGVTKFIIHKKNGNGFYGRPASIGSLTEQYIEYKEMVYRCTNATNRFNPDVLMEVSGRDPAIRQKENEEAIKSGYEHLEEQLNFKVSAGNASAPSVLLTEKPYAGDNIFIHEFNVVTKEKYFLTSKSISKEVIFLSHNWSQKLGGVPMASGWSNEAFLDELSIKEVTIRSVQNAVEQPMNDAFYEIANFMNPEMSKYSANFIHPFINVLNQRRQNVTNSVGSGK